MTERPVSTSRLPHDPLGPTKRRPKPGSQASTWKKHFRKHGRQWMIGSGAAFSLSVVLLLAWSVMKSIEAYGTGPSPATTMLPVRPTVRTQPRQTRTIEGPVQIRISIGRLMARERVLVLRDIHRILATRLKEQGFDVQPAADNIVSVRYREMAGEPVKLVVGSQREEVGEIPTIKAYVEVSMEGPSGALNLGQKTVTTGTTSIAIDGDVRSARGRNYNSLGQKVYRATLAFLYRVDLPVPKS